MYQSSKGRLECVCVMLAYSGLEIGSYEVAFMTEHASGDVVGELFNLFIDVVEEGITGLPSYHHVSEGGGNSCEVHYLDGSESDGVGANI